MLLISNQWFSWRCICNGNTLERMLLKTHELLAADSCSNIIALLKDLLFFNNIPESENKALQKYSVTFKKVAEHGNSWSWAVKKQLNLMSDVWTPHIAHSVFLSDMFTLLQHLLFCTHPLLKFSLVLGHVPKAFKMYPYAESDLEPPQHQRQGFCDNS